MSGSHAAHGSRFEDAWVKRCLPPMFSHLIQRICADIEKHRTTEVYYHTPPIHKKYVSLADIYVNHHRLYPQGATRILAAVSLDLTPRRVDSERAMEDAQRRQSEQSQHLVPSLAYRLFVAERLQLNAWLSVFVERLQLPQP